MKGFYTRGYLPHFDGGEIPQMVTIRLIDSFPTALLQEWEQELSLMHPIEAECERHRRIEDYLDKGLGTAWLSRPDIADLVARAVRLFDGTRYLLHAWCVMPNHVHVLLTPREGEILSGILHSWKSFTAQKANALLGKQGPFWQREYFDRFVRSENHFAEAVIYIENNPVKAGLCEDPVQWPFGSAYQPAWSERPK